ncbi:hypothetical protein [Streptomyces sp. NPDC049040]|uniref:hypothetical protein n=1 Tax=Streptomyces sp. NPDC049040 TaxID=3365593 RepID=UPI003722999C
MGFSGMLVFCRNQRPLAEVSVFGGLPQEVRDRMAERGEWWLRPGGWRTGQVGGDWRDETMLRDLAARSGAPACVGFVYDSDVVYVRGLSPSGREWSATLNLEVAAELRVDPPGDVDDPLEWSASAECAQATARKIAEFDAEVPDAAREALAWAAEAGCGAGVELTAVETMLRSKPEVFAEELFSDMIDVLGFPAAEEPPSVPAS